MIWCGEVPEWTAIGVAKGGLVQPVIDTSKAALGAGVRLLSGRQGQLPGRPGDRRKAMQSWRAVARRCRENRAFLGRAVRYLAGEAGHPPVPRHRHRHAQLDNTTRSPRRSPPDARVVYVDNDPIVIAHARALLAGTPEGRTATSTPTCGNRTDPGEPAVRGPRPDRPVALMLVAMLHFIPTTTTRPASSPPCSRAAVRQLPRASHGTPEHDPEGVGGLVRAYRQGGIPAQVRTASQFTPMAFGGLQMIDPGVVLVSEWRGPDGPHPNARRGQLVRRHRPQALAPGGAGQRGCSRAGGGRNRHGGGRCCCDGSGSAMS